MIKMSNTIEYIKGDLFTHLDSFLVNSSNSNSGVWIPHIVNNKGRMGSGFVVPLCKRYPTLKSSYYNYYNSYVNNLYDGDDYAILGNVQFLKFDRVTVCNMFAQNDTISKINPKPIRYAALVRCMETIRDIMPSQGVIFAPKFGAGLAGGDWKMIESLIEDIWIYNKKKVVIFEL